VKIEQNPAIKLTKERKRLRSSIVCEQNAMRVVMGSRREQMHGSKTLSGMPLILV
jgi:hypothetical protein